MYDIFLELFDQAYFSERFWDKYEKMKTYILRLFYDRIYDVVTARRQWNEKELQAKVAIV